MLTGTSDPQTQTRNGIPNPLPQEISRRVQRLHKRRNLDGLRDEAIRTAEILDHTRQQMEQLSMIHVELRQQIETLTTPEQYGVTVTAVYPGACWRAEVAGLAGRRVRVSVHPDIDRDKLRVGAQAVVSRERNCLLEVLERPAPWQRVGVFERRLGASNRILLRDREVLVAVEAVDELAANELKPGDLVGFDPDLTGLAFQRLQPPSSEQLFDEQVSDDFSQLGGLESQIGLVKRQIDFRLRYPELASKYRLKSKCGILLEGRPGNGKTRLARCCAGYVRSLFPDRRCRFMHVSGSGDYSMWLGESEQNIVKRFAAVREAAREGLVVMFWDEVDAIAKRRGSDFGGAAPDRILNTFLSQLDGVVPLSNVLILFATNRADSLDPAFLRGGRTDLTIRIPAPGRRAAAAILERYLSDGLPLGTRAAANGRSVERLITPLLSRLFSPGGDLARVAGVKFSDGRRIDVAGRELLSGAMLENVVAAACQQAACREVETGQQGLAEEDLQQTLDQEMVAAVSLLTPANIKSHVHSIPQHAQPIAVEPILDPNASTYRRW